MVSLSHLTLALAPTPLPLCRLKSNNRSQSEIGQINQRKVDSIFYRLKILSSEFRPPETYQDLLILPKTCRYFQRPVDTYKDLQSFTKTCIYFQRPVDTSKDLQIIIKTSIHLPMPVETSKHMQRLIKTCRDL